MHGMLRNRRNKEQIQRGVSPEEMKLRRWSAADTNRLNEAHWEKASDSSINDDLQDRLKTLRMRCEYERANNPFVAGVIESHCIAIAGAKDFPKVDVRTSNRVYGDKLQEYIRQWWQSPSASGTLSGTQVVKLWVQQCWTGGEFLSLLVTDPDAAGPVSLRLQTIRSSRLETPMQEPDGWLLGIKRNSLGQPVLYWIADESDVIGNIPLSGVARSADEVIHGFRMEEPGQIRGIPWLTPALNSIADLRDYDDQVLDAARAAADQAIIMKCTNPDVEVWAEEEEPIEIERRMITQAPRGWEPVQMSPTQPATSYKEFRESRLADLGRPVSMPQMMVLLDSADHSYSSARIDGKLYAQGCENIQGWLELSLNKVLEAVEKELRVGGLLGPRPEDLMYAYTWPTPPEADPVKEAMNERIRLQNGSLSYRGACASHGLDVDDVIEHRRKDKEALEAAGLPSDFNLLGKGKPDANRK